MELIKRLQLTENKVIELKKESIEIKEEIASLKEK